jgi:hypothetical protein
VLRSRARHCPSAPATRSAEPTLGSSRSQRLAEAHIIDELVVALLTCTSFADVFRDGIAFLLANARRANPKRDLKLGRLRSGLLVVGARP